MCSRFDTIPVCDGRTERQMEMDGTVVASTALAMQCAVKTLWYSYEQFTEHMS